MRIHFTLALVTPIAGVLVHMLIWHVQTDVSMYVFSPFPLSARFLHESHVACFGANTTNTVKRVATCAEVSPLSTCNNAMFQSLDEV